jgi:putative tryptophan/tyrosine transport system substrate-binding protein
MTRPPSPPTLLLSRHTKRREFIAVLGGAAAWPLVARAQSRKIPRVGVLWHAGDEKEEAIFLGALRKGLNDLGYVEGTTVELVNRFADEHYDRFDRLAAELVEAKVDIIVASVPSAAYAAKRVTSTTPVVLAYGGDYVAQGLAQTLAHPGGNVTGLSAMFVDLAGKHLEILKDCIASLSSAALLFNANASKPSRTYISEVQKAAASLRISLHVVEVGSRDDLEQGFSAIENTHAGAVLLASDSLFFQQRERIAQLALANRVPTIAWTADMADAGVLVSYGADAPDLFRRAATYVDKILKGANPADLPIQQPTKFEFVINLKTAKALGLTIPPSVLSRADKVFE